MRSINAAGALVRLKENYYELILTISSSKCHFLYIFTSHPKVVVSRSKVDPRKVACNLELIKKVVNLRKRILVVNSDFIEFAIINVHSKGPILLLHNQYWSTP